MKNKENTTQNPSTNKFWGIVLACFIAAVTAAAIFAIAVSMSSIKALADFTPSITENQNEMVPMLFHISTSETAEISTSETARSETGTLTLKDENGAFVVTNDSCVVLISSKGKKAMIPMSGFGGETHKVKYSYNKDTVEIDSYTVRVTDDTFSDIGITEFSYQDKHIATGVKGIGNASVIISANTPLTEEIKQTFIEILSSIHSCTGEQTIHLLGETINPDILTGIEFDTEVIEINTTQNPVYVSFFTGETTGAGFDQTIKLGKNITAKYSDIKDSQTGLSPYLANVNGSTLKFLAQDKESLSSLFCN